MAIPINLPPEIERCERPFRYPRVMDYEEIEVSRQREVKNLKKAGYRLAKRRRRGNYVLWKWKPKWVIFEDEMREFLVALKFRNTGAGKLGRFPVEVYGGFDGSFLIVDCTLKGEPGYKSLSDKIYKIHGKRGNFERSVKSRYGGKYKEIKYVIATRKIDVSQNHEVEARKNGIAIWNEDYLEMYKNLFKAVGPLAAYWILRELDAKPKRIRDRTGKRYYGIPAFEVKEGNIIRYTFVTEAGLLAIIGYVSRILSGAKNAYQRALYLSKINKIVRFIEDGGSFPNNIIANLRKAHFKPKRQLGENIRFGMLNLPKEYASVEIIDGQHRLYGIWKTGGGALNQKLVVTAFKDLDTIEQAKIYVDINKNQKPVDPGDLWYLAPIRDPKSKEAWITRIVMCINEKGIFENKIYIPLESKRPKKSYGIYLASFCGGLKYTKLFEYLRPNLDSTENIDETIESAAKFLNNFFKFVEKIGTKTSKRWNKGFFFHNNGLNVMLRLCGETLDYFNRIPEQDEVVKLLNEGLLFYCKNNTNRIDELRGATSSEGGRTRVAYKEIAPFIAQTTRAREFANVTLAHIQNLRKFPRLANLRAMIPELEASCREFIRKGMLKVFRKGWQTKLIEKFSNKYEKWNTQSQSKGGKDVLDGVTFGECVEIIRSFPNVFRLGVFVRDAFNLVLNARKELFHPMKPSDSDISEEKHKDIQTAFDIIREYVEAG